MPEDSEYQQDNLTLNGFYRAKVVKNKDDKFYGRIEVWVPDIMPEVPEDQGIQALPANNPISGLNDEGDDEHYYSGSSYVPPKGSWIWVFFENGNPSKPFYFAGMNLENTKILPECQIGGNPQKKWVLYKSRMGRCIVISDDTDDERVEITGKKREISDDPSGDKDSVTKIDGNMTTILVDEREGKEKVLIRTVKGDFIHIDIDEQQLQIKFEKDLQILTNKNCYFTAKEDIHILSEKNIKLEAKEGLDIKIGKGAKFSSGEDMQLKTDANFKLSASGTLDHKAGGEMNLYASKINENTSDPGDADEAGEATKADPQGERDT